MPGSHASVARTDLASRQVIGSLDDEGGLRVPIEIRDDTFICDNLAKHGNERGLGVTILKDIRKGQLVVEFVGELITTEQANIRDDFYQRIGRDQFFSLTITKNRAIDPTIYGNFGRFINHSCNPELANKISHGLSL